MIIMILDFMNDSEKTIMYNKNVGMSNNKEIKLALSEGLFASYKRGSEFAIVRFIDENKMHDYDRRTFNLPPRLREIIDGTNDKGDVNNG